MADRAVDVIVQVAGADVLAGRLYAHRRREAESASFAYDADYLASPDAYSLDPTLPLTQGPLHTAVGVAMFGAFTDTAPDRWGRTLLQRAEVRRATRQGGTPRRLGELDYLLGVRDDLRHGAIRFREPDTGAFLAGVDADVPLLADLARLLHLSERYELAAETDEELGDLLRAGSSLGGARPKAHVLDADGRVSIAKFPSGDTDAWSVPAWEMVALDLAARAGVTVPRSRLLRVGGRAVLILARFDRVGDRRIGYASAMTMLEARERDQRSYLDIAGVIEQRSDRATDELHQLWRRVAFTVLISNTDDHLRNHGFVHVDRSVWRLSPAFDLNPTPGPARARLRTTIDGSTDAASIDLLLSVAPSFRLDQAEAIAALGQVSAATRGWRHVAGDHGLPAREVDLMTPAFEHDEAETARRITR